MASITPNTKNGKIRSYRFRACVGRDKMNRQIFRSTTWSIPDGLTPSKAERSALKAAEQWEKQVRAEYEKDLKAPEHVKRREIGKVYRKGIAVQRCFSMAEQILRAYRQYWDTQMPARR